MFNALLLTQQNKQTVATSSPWSPRSFRRAT